MLLFIIPFFLLWIYFCFLVKKYWKEKGLKDNIGMLISLFFSPLLGYLIGSSLQSNQFNQEKLEEGLFEKEKYCKCSFCGCYTNKTNKYCIHCGKKL